MIASSPKAVIVRGPDLLEFFCENLQKVLARLGSSYNVVDSQAEAAAVVNDVDMILVDPSVRDFDPDRLHRALKGAARKPSVVIVAPVVESGHKVVEQKIGRAIAVPLFFSVEELTFVLNQVLFIEKSNKRRSPRIITDIEANYQLTNNDKQKTSQIFNISQGGLYLASYSPPDVGVRLELTFSLPGTEDELRCVAQVCHRHPYMLGEKKRTLPAGAGLRFAEKSNDFDKNLEQYLNERMPQLFRDHMAE